MDQEDESTSDKDSDEPEDDDEPSPKSKNWNIPKKHLRSHLFDTIEDKGVCRNSSTKPNEGMHRPIRASYLRRTNFKNFGEQVCFHYTFKRNDFLIFNRF